MTTYHTTKVNGLDTFYREAGSKDAPVIVLMHGFPSSSHMYRDLIPKLADRFRVIAPDYIGFGYSAMPSTAEFEYSFANVTRQVEALLFDALKVERFWIYVQDYGAPVGFRIASAHPDAIEGIIVQNGNAYPEGISPAFEPLKAWWTDRNAETEKAARGLLDASTTKFQYTHGAAAPELVSPDSYTFDQMLLDRPGNDQIQLSLLYNYPSNVALYPQWHEFFRARQPRTLIVWGQNDPFFTVEGAMAFLRDLPGAELHLIEAGHFALETHSDFIADRIREFFGHAAGKAA